MHYKHFEKYTNNDKKTIEKLFVAGASDRQIAEVIGRTRRAVSEQRLKQGLVKKKGRTPKLEPKRGARYTRYMKPKTELSLLCLRLHVTCVT